MVFQGTFAIITAALIAGAVVERMRFPAFLLFITLWSLAVYAPVAKWVWGGGFLASLGTWDFAGGTVVHINAGVAALVAALVLGARKDYGRQAILPHNVPFVLLGAALLWFGWFGFNAGSAWAASPSATLALANTILARSSRGLATCCRAASVVVWLLTDLLRTGKITPVGLANAIVVGLVVITPAAAYLAPIFAMLMGALGALSSYFALQWRAKSRVDYSLDVFAIHGVAGLVGAIFTGVFAQNALNGYFDGLIAGNPEQVLLQLAKVVVVAYSGVVTFVLLKLVGALTPLKASAKEEGLGMDPTQHGEGAYSSGEGAILVNTEAAPSPIGRKPVAGTD